MSPAERPARLVVIVGTATEVGKTWAAVRLLKAARTRGLRVAVRKPVQSFDPDDSHATDAAQLAEASGEAVEVVCPRHRWYPAAMAPPMAADRLHRPSLLLKELLAEISWPAATDLGLVETVGGVYSPLTHDADSRDLAARVAPDDVLLVADAGLGAINAVRLAVAAMTATTMTVLLNRFDADNDLHRRNRHWLETRDRLRVIVDPTALL